jgi:hypothetical protein
MENFETLKNLPITMDADFVTLNAKVQTAMQPFQTLKVTSGTIGDAKLTRAELNKLADAIDTQRKSIEKIYNQPIDLYKGKVKELLSHITLAVKHIDDQVKTFENEEKDAKKIEIQTFFATLNSPVDLLKVWNASWLNATTSTKAWQTELTQKVEKIKTDLVLLSSQTTDPLLTNLYLELLDPLQAIQRYKALKSPVEVKKEPAPLLTFKIELFATEQELKEVLRFCDERHITWSEIK